MGAIQVPRRKHKQKNRSVEDVKYIAFWELDLEDMDKVIEKDKQVNAEREKGTEKFPKTLSDSYSIGGESKGFILYETDDPDQLTNIALHYAPEMKWKFMPIFEASKFIELYLKMQ